MKNNTITIFIPETSEVIYSIDLDNKLHGMPVKHMLLECYLLIYPYLVNENPGLENYMVYIKNFPNNISPNLLDIFVDNLTITTKDQIFVEESDNRTNFSYHAIVGDISTILFILMSQERINADIALWRRKLYFKDQVKQNIILDKEIVSESSYDECIANNTAIDTHNDILKNSTFYKIIIGRCQPLAQVIHGNFNNVSYENLELGQIIIEYIGTKNIKISRIST
jgi:hypothetical protein